MKVYVVVYFDTEDWDIDKVFSSLEAAKKYASDSAAKDDVYQYEVLEYEVCPDLEKDSDVDDDWFEPNDYPEGDIGSATVAEIRRQNGE